jgi:hypothetical protein
MSALKKNPRVIIVTWFKLCPLTLSPIVFSHYLQYIKMPHTIIILDGHPNAFLPTQRIENTSIPPTREKETYIFFTQSPFLV